MSDLDKPQSDRPEPLTMTVFGPTHFPCSLTPNSEVYHNSLSPFQLPPSVHVLALCHCTKTPFSSPRFLNMGNHYQIGTLCLRVCFFPCSFVYCRLFACCLFPDSSIQWSCRQRICAYTPAYLPSCPLIIPIVCELCFHIKCHDLTYRAERN